MSRYRGPKLRVTRRLGALPGFSLSLTEKKGGKFWNHAQRPGQHGANKKKQTQYAIRLEEKQKLRFNYGVSEKQLMNYVRQAKRIKGATGTVLLQLLEMRLDNVIFRLGMAPTITGARQIVNHRHILVNKISVSIPSYQCQPGDSITVKDSKISKQLVMKNLTSPTLSKIPPNLELQAGSGSSSTTGATNGSTSPIDSYKGTLGGRVLSIIDREWVALHLNELFVIEFYSRKI
jgi:small subunit ribosomal protein S4